MDESFQISGECRSDLYNFTVFASVETLRIARLRSIREKKNDSNQVSRDNLIALATALHTTVIIPEYISVCVW